MCDQCQALRINGHLCHETGCPNTPIGTCDRCGDPITIAGGTWRNQDSEWTGFEYCSEECADANQSEDETYSDTAPYSEGSPDSWDAIERSKE